MGLLKRLDAILNLKGVFYPLMFLVMFIDIKKRTNCEKYIHVDCDLI